MVRFDDFMAMMGGEEATPNMPAEQQCAAPPETSNPPVDTDRVSGDRVATKLGDLTYNALLVKEELMNLPLPETDAENFAAVARTKNAASGDVLGTATKVQENLLRQEQSDDLTELLRKVNEFRKANPRFIAKDESVRLEADREREQGDDDG